MVGTKFDIHSWSGCGYRIPTGRSLSLFCPSYLISISFFVSKIQFNIYIFPDPWHMLCPKLACRYICTNGQMELTSRGSNCCLIYKIPCALFVSQKIDVLCYRWDNHYLLVQLLEPRNNSPAPMSLPHFSDLLYYSYSLVLALLHT